MMCQTRQTCNAFFPGPSDQIKIGSMVWTWTRLLLYLQSVQSQARLMEGTRDYLVNVLSFAFQLNILTAEV